MNTIQLECFVSVAEHLNFSRASEELKITQPAVSHQIRTLEQELDVKLFRRTSKSVSLTQEGMMFLPDAQIILKTALSAKERLGRKEHVLPLDIGCHNHMEMNLLPPVFHDLVKEFPFLRPGIHLVPFPSLLGQVVNRADPRRFRRPGSAAQGPAGFPQTLFHTNLLCLYAGPSLCRTESLDGKGFYRKQKQYHCLLSPPCFQLPFFCPKSSAVPASPGTKIFRGWHRERPCPGKGENGLYSVSGYASDPGAWSCLYSDQRSSYALFWRFLSAKRRLSGNEAVPSPASGFFAEGFLFIKSRAASALA